MKHGGEGRYVARIRAYFAGRLLSTIPPAELREIAMALYPDAMPSTRNRQAVSR